MTQNNEAKKPETKKTDAAGAGATQEKTPEQLLKEKRAEFVSLRKEGDKRMLDISQKRKDAQQTALSQRQKAVGEKKSVADEQKNQHKQVFDSVRENAVKVYNEAVAQAAKTKDDSINAAHAVKEAAYREISHRLEQECAPFIDIHKVESRRIDDEFTEEMAKANSEIGQKTAVIVGEITELERQVEAREKERQANPPRKGDQPKPQGRHDHVKADRSLKAQQSPQQKDKQPDAKPAKQPATAQ